MVLLLSSPDICILRGDSYLNFLHLDSSNFCRLTGSIVMMPQNEWVGYLAAIIIFHTCAVLILTKFHGNY